MSAVAIQPSPQSSGSYVLMTAAHNEEDHIEGVIRSVLAQTVLPKRWVIVSDNSTDGTDEIVQGYAHQHDFIRLLHTSRVPGRDFGSKVLALREGSKLLGNVQYDFIGNVDADVAFEPSYFATLMRHFQQCPELGISGGFLYESSQGQYRCMRFNDTRNVFHAAQLVRRECYHAIGGYEVLKYGGEDWYAQTRARMEGWKAASLPHLKVFHHRPITAGSSPLGNAFRQGRQDYSFGSNPLFEIFKCLRRIPERPYLGNSLARLAGFAYASLCQQPLAVSPEFSSFLRREQKQRLSDLLRPR